MSLLIWSDGTGRAGNNTLMLDIETKPELPFPFDTLYYEPLSNMYLKIIDGVQSPLTLAEALTCENEANRLVDTADYPVQGIAEDAVFAGVMLRSEADKQGLEWCLDVPEHPASKRVNGKWEHVVAVIMDNGTLKEMPESICQLCVLHFTAEEWEGMEKPSSPYETWDFKLEKWVDKRTLPAVQAEACGLVRRVVEDVRNQWLQNIPPLERDTWTKQEAEARAWVMNPEVQTPFLDLLRKGRDVLMPDLCAVIITNADKAWNILGHAHNLQWRWFDSIKACTSVKAVDDLVFQFGNVDFKQEAPTWLFM